MNNKLLLPIVLSISLVIVTMFIIANDMDNSTTVVSSTGCCSISVTHIDVVEDEDVYRVVYTDNTSVDDTLTLDCFQSELDSTVNYFEDMCYSTHN